MTRRSTPACIAGAWGATLLVLGCGGSDCDSLPLPPEVLVIVRGAATATDCADELVRGSAGDVEAEVVCRTDSYDDAACACSLYTLTDGPHRVELLAEGEVVDSAEVDVVPGLCGPETEAVEFDYPAGSN